MVLPNTAVVGCKFKKKIHSSGFELSKKEKYIYPTLEISCANIYMGRCETAWLKLSRAIFLTDLSVPLQKKKKEREIEEL